MSSRSRIRDAWCATLARGIETVAGAEYVPRCHQHADRRGLDVRGGLVDDRRNGARLHHHARLVRPALPQADTGEYRRGPAAEMGRRVGITKMVAAARFGLGELAAVGQRCGQPDAEMGIASNNLPKVTFLIFRKSKLPEVVTSRVKTLSRSIVCVPSGDTRRMPDSARSWSRSFGVRRPLLSIRNFPAPRRINGSNPCFQCFNFVCLFSRTL